MVSNQDQVHAARDRLFQALDEQGFADAITRLADERPPATHVFRDAMDDDAYRGRVHELASEWDLGVGWFYEYIHARAWAATGNSPTVHYGHHLSEPWGVLHATFELGGIGSRTNAPPTAHAFGRALWPDTRKEEVWREVRAAFDTFWEEQVLPPQQQQPDYHERSRRPVELLRNARAFAIRARLRRTSPSDLPGAVANELKRRFGTAVRDADSLERAVMRFRELVLRRDT